MAVEIITSFNPINDASGDPVSGAKVYVYDVGTTTPRSIYSDTGLSVTVSNPIICNSAGRTTTDGGTTVGMVYTATGSYKIVVKTSADVTLYTLDNIDGRVPVGSGALAIANGGTGATSAAAALAALGAATADELADLAADVAALSGAAASTEKTHIATGTTAQRPATPVEGDIRRNTTITGYEVYDGSNWRVWITDNFTACSSITEDTTPDPANDWIFTMDVSAGNGRKVHPSSHATALNATQSQQEAGTATTALVSPAVQQYHPSASKCWANFNAAGTVAASYNTASVTDNGTGDFTVNIGTDFSGASYCGQLTSSDNNAATDPTVINQDGTNAPAAGTFRALCYEASTASVLVDPSNQIYATFFGDQ